MHLGPGGIEAARRIHHEIGAPALFLVGHLLGQQGMELLRRHAGPLEDAGALHVARRRHHHDGVDPPVAAGLEQQRNVEHHDRARRAARASAGSAPRLAHQRMHDGLEAGKAAGSPSTPGRELAAVDLPAVVVPGNAASIAAAASPS